MRKWIIWLIVVMLCMMPVALAQEAAPETEVVLEETAEPVQQEEVPEAEEEIVSEEEPLAEEEIIAEEESLAEEEIIAEEESLAEEEIIAVEEPLAEEEIVTEEEPLAEEEPAEEEEPEEEDSGLASKAPYSGKCGNNVEWSYNTSKKTITIAGNGAMADVFNWGLYETTLKSKATKVVIEEGVTHIGNNAFAEFENLTTVELPSTLRTIGSNAFWGCHIQEISLPEGLTEIGAGAFIGCGMQTITIPSTVTTIGASAFSGSYLKSVTIPAKVTYYASAFKGAGWITSATIESGVKTIPENAFKDCVNLESVTIPNSVTSIGANAFKSCANLTALTLPDGITSIAGTAFDDCSAVLTCNYGSATAKALAANGLQYRDKNGFTYMGGTIIKYEGTASTPTIPEGITTIGENAFSSSKIESIVIPASVKTIGKGAFYLCQKMTTITFEGTVDRIEDETFYGCSALKTLTIPDGVKTIGANVFEMCLELEWVEFPESLTEIDSNNHFEFSTAKRLCAFNGNAAKTLTKAGMYYQVRGSEALFIKGTEVFQCASDATEITIPEGVTSIGEHTFSGKGSIVSIAIPETVTTVGEGAFDDCPAARLCVYNGKAAKVLENAGYAYNPVGYETVSVLGTKVVGCTTNATEVTIPDGMTAIAENAFKGKSKLTTVTIPETVTTVGEGAFDDCPAARVCVYNGTAAKALESAGYGYAPKGYEALTMQGTKVLDCDETVTEVTLPAGTTEIAKDAFKNCAALTGIEIPETVTTVGEGAFDDCPAARVCAYNGTAAKALENAGYSYTPKGYEALTMLGTKVLDCDEKATEVTIPAGTTEIAAQAFCNCTLLTEIEIPEGITRINEGTFMLCASLASVTLPTTLKEIGDSAFQCCTSLTSIDIPDGVTDIGKGAFDTCGLTEITIPTGVTILRANLLSNCANLQKVTLHDGITTLSDSVFAGCDKLESITLPESVTEIEGTFANCGAKVYCAFNGNAAKAMTEASFSYCVKGYEALEFMGTAVTGCDKSATKVIIPEGVTEIGTGAFSECKDLVYVSIPSTVTAIDVRAFYRCGALKTIKLPEKLTTIGEGAFFASGLTEITIPNAVTGVGNHAFGACTALKEVTFPEKSLTTIGVSAFRECTSLTKIVVPDSVTAIGKDAFKDCTALKDVTIPEIGETLLTEKKISTCSISDIFENTAIESLTLTRETSLAEYALSGIKSGYIYLPETLEKVNSYAFDDCGAKCVCTFNGNAAKALEEAEISYIAAEYDTLEFLGTTVVGAQEDITWVNIPEGVTAIGDGAFAEQTELTDVTIPVGVTSIGNEAFYECYALKSITLPEGVTKIGENAFKYSGLTNITIPGSVTEMGVEAFRACDDLCSVTISEGVKSIGDGAFINCYELRAITIPQSVTSIGEYAFSDCSAMESVTLCEGLTEIGDKAFAGCEMLTEITVPNSVTKIGKRAFRNCNALTSITLPFVGDGDENGCFYYVFGSSAEDIPESLTTVTITNQEVLEEEAFANCANLTSVTLPDTLEYIEEKAFANCSGLTTFTIPESVIYIGDEAFANCVNLTSLRIPAIEDYTTATRAFGKTQQTHEKMDAVLCTGTTDMEQLSEATKQYSGIAQADSAEETAGINADDALESKGAPVEFEDEFEEIFDDNDENVTETVVEFIDNEEEDEEEDEEEILEEVFEEPIEVPEEPKEEPEEESKEASEEESKEESEESNKQSAEQSVVCYLGDDIFDGCDKLQSITIDSVNWWCRIDHAATKLYLRNSGNLYLKDGTPLTNITITSSIVTEGSFTYCKSLTKVTLSDSVDTVERCAFISCSNLSSVVMKEGVTDIGENAFAMCGKLKAISFADSIEYIGAQDFAGNVPLLYCSKGSAAESWAKDEGYTNYIRYTDEATTEIVSFAIVDSIALEKGETFTIAPTFYPEGSYTVTYASADANVATVSDTGVVTATGKGETTITATCGTLTQTMKVYVTLKAQSLTLPEYEIWMKKGDTYTITPNVQPAECVVMYEYAPNSSVISVENGVITAKEEGTAEVVVSSNDKFKTLKVNVYENIVSIDGQDELTVSVGSSCVLDVLVENEKGNSYEDARMATLTSSDTKVATVSADGTVTGVSVGEATITIVVGDIKKTCRVTVTCKAGTHTVVTDAAIPAGYYNDGFTTFKYCSACGKVLVSQKRIDRLDFPETDIHYTNAAITLINATMNVGESAFIAMDCVISSGLDVTAWKSSSAKVATVADGMVKALAEGKTTITCTCSNKKSFRIAITVTDPEKPESVTLSQTTAKLEVGATAQLTATVKPVTCMDNVVYASSKKTVATVDASGVITAVAEGSTKITATVTHGKVKKTATCTVTVTDSAKPTALTLSPASPQTLSTGGTLVINCVPTNKTGSAKADSFICVVDKKGQNLVTVRLNAKTGKATVTAKATEGKATLTFTAIRGKTKKTAKMVINVVDPYKPTSIELCKGVKNTVLSNLDTVTMTATVLPATAKGEVTYTLDKNGLKVATIDAKTGELTPIAGKTGSGTVTATVVYGKIKKSASAKFTIVDPYALYAVTVQEKDGITTIKAGETCTLNWSVSPASVDLANCTVTWKSSAAAATVDANGVVTGVKKGKATITATVTQKLNGKTVTKKGTIKITVTK